VTAANGAAVTTCAYESASWRCAEGELVPPFGGASPFRQPCPACNTEEFIAVALRRSGTWRRSGLCPFCAPPGADPAAAALDMAIRAAFEANPAEADRIATANGIHSRHFPGRRPFCRAVE
jgi:hypothetical protein